MCSKRIPVFLDRADEGLILYQWPFYYIIFNPCFVRTKNYEYSCSVDHMTLENFVSNYRTNKKNIFIYLWLEILRLNSFQILASKYDRVIVKRIDALIQWQFSSYFRLLYYPETIVKTNANLSQNTKTNFYQQ